NTWEAITRLESLYRTADTNAQSRELFVGSARLLGLLPAPHAMTFVFPAYGQHSNAEQEFEALLRAFPSTMRVADVVNFLSAKTTHFEWVAQLITQLLERFKPMAPSMSLWDLKGKTDEIFFLNGMASARAAARKAKDFEEADRIRAELEAMGIALKDSKDPKTGELVTTWEVKR
ncbi:MAG TPA: hypothetical protein VG894_00070, partial [Bauldia sp.]|nr:hypothetical protein [Bauldia sp.]